MFRLSSRESRNSSRFNTLSVFKHYVVTYVGLDYNFIIICLRGREIFYKLTKSTEKNVFEFEIRN